MPTDRRDRVQHWRALATDAMTAANLTTDAPSRTTLLNIAAAYERLADRAEEAPSVASVPAVFEATADLAMPNSTAQAVARHLPPAHQCHSSADLVLIRPRRYA